MLCVKSQRARPVCRMQGSAFAAAFPLSSRSRQEQVIIIVQQFDVWAKWGLNSGLIRVESRIRGIPDRNVLRGKEYQYGGEHLWVRQGNGPFHIATSARNGKDY